MRTMRRLAGGLATLALLATIQGCDGGGGGTPSVSSSHDKVKVSGTVKVGGTPLASGKITFDGANISRKDVMPATAEIKDGKFEIEAVVGGNNVSVMSPELKAEKAMNQKIVEVKSGEAVDIDL